MTSILIQGAIFTGLPGDAMRANKGASAVTVTAVGALGERQWRPLARLGGWLRDCPGRLADLAIFDLSHPRYFGLHDPLIELVVSAGDARLAHPIVRGCVVVTDGTISGIDLAQLRHDTARVVAHLAS